MPKAATVSPVMTIGYTDAITNTWFEGDGHEVTLRMTVAELAALKAGDAATIANLIYALNNPYTGE